MPQTPKLPESIQNKLTSINQVRDSLEQLIGDDKIEQEILRTKLERVDNAIEIYQELSQTYPEKASTYLERFENALDNVKANLDTKLESHIEHNALDFEVALRMLELNDNNLSQ